MTTINEFRAARDSSGLNEPDVRTMFAHCRGFSSGGLGSRSDLRPRRVPQSVDLLRASRAT